MSRFLKLTDAIINVNHIRLIQLKSNKYKIQLATNYFDGFWLLGSGSIKSNSYEVTVCEKEHPEDYKLVTKWINKNSEL